MNTDGWRKVLATHEEPQTLSTGPWLGDNYPGVALPSVHALHRWIQIRYNGRYVCACCKDVGPWCHDDEGYVFRGETPRAERLIGRTCYTTEVGSQLPTAPDGNGRMREAPKSNGAGIDLFPATARALGLKEQDNALVEWRFVPTE